MKVALLIVFTSWTLVTAITRVTDNWHHPTDVLGIQLLSLCLGSEQVFSHFAQRVQIPSAMISGGLILALSFVIPYFGRGHFKADSVYSLRDISPPRVHFE